MTNKERLTSYLKPDRKRLIIASLFAFLYVVCYLAQPFLLGKALDASKAGLESIFITLLIISLSMVILGTFFAYFFELVMSNVSQRIVERARRDICKKINAVSISQIDIREKGDIVQLEIRDMENFTSGLFAIFKTLIQGLFTIGVTIVLMVMVNWILALGVIILTPLSVLMSRFIASFSHKHFSKQAKIQGEISSISLETLNNMEIVQANNYEQEALNKFKKKNEELKKVGILSSFSASWVNPSTRLVNNTIYVIIGVVGIIMLSFDRELGLVLATISVGGLSAFLSYTNQYSKPFNEISGVVNEYEAMKASFNRINSFLNSDDDIDEGKEELTSVDEIVFKNMSFSYDSTQKLIENLNLTIKRGNKVAIVGPTGAGKTTLINLLMRFYDPLDGDIFINGESYKNIKKSSLRNKVGMVLQDTYIFSASILDNICYLKENASEEEVKEVAKKVHADTFIEQLPNKYQAIITNKDGLSEGQKQMIAIARVMLLNPDLVILDEATSNIDTRSEQLINQAFDEIMKKKTSIVIAHRLSTIISSDLIIVMNEGHIVETGTHQQLLLKKGFYYNLYTSQYK